MTFAALQPVLDWVLLFHITLPVVMLFAAALLPSGAAALEAYLRPIARALDAFAKHLGHALSWLALAMVLVTTCVVLLRYVFGLSFIWMQESITYMHGLLFMLAASYTLYVDGHVRVDVFYRTASERTRALVDLLGTYFFLFPVMFLLIDTALPYVEFSWSVHEGSKETSGIQAIYLLKSAILVFCYLMIMQGIANAIHRAAELAGLEGKPEHEEAKSIVHPSRQGEEAS